MIRLLLFVFTAFFSSMSFAQGVVNITESNKNQPFSLRGNLFYLIDSSKQLKLSDVLNEANNRNFIQAEKSEFLFPRNSSTIWFKLSIQNKTEEAQQVVLQLKNPFVKDITFFSSLDSVFYYTGAGQFYEQRQVESKNFLFNIHLKPNEKTSCCLKISGQETPLYLPFSLITQKQLNQQSIKDSRLLGIVYALELLFILLTIMLWRTENNKIYFYLLLFLIGIIIHNFWHEGFFFKYVWSHSAQFNVIFGRTISILLIPLFLLFVNSYLKIARKNKPIGKIYRIILVLLFVYLVVQIFYYNYVLHQIVLKLFFTIAFVGCIWGIIASRNKKLNLYKQFVVAVFLLLIDLSLRVFFYYESKSFGFGHQNIFTFGWVVFFILSSNVFLIKFRNSRLAVLDLNKNLEQLVDKRTEQLSHQKEELKAQHEEMVLQKDTLQTQREELRAQKELLEIKNVELEKLSLVASKTDNLIYIFDAIGELNWFNKSFGNILGISLEEYQRGEPYSIIDVSSNKNIRHVLNTCLREKSVVSYESAYYDDNNNAKWFHTTLTPILDEQENIKHLIAIDTDITRLKHYEEELNQQRTDAENQKNLAVKRKEELEERQIEITDSIRYAKRIQTAIMPKIKQIARDFQDSFVLFLPKDIVSGDFYWYHRIGDKYIIAAVDCTGHGVPGAFMSIIGNYLLNSIIIYNQVYDPSEILKQLNRKIKIALKSDNRSQTNDGMDVSIAVIDKNNNSIEIASALRPIYLFCKGDFIEIKGDKIPITSNISGTSISSYKKHTYPFNAGDKFYMFSDGIIDQFGGKNGKKFLTKRFKQLLFEINPLTMREQKEIIKKAFDEWRQDNEQVDDILVMGIKFSEDYHR
ncbi:MAG: SpoIIE family protein phosphatase [Salinivirgaceae bacterium]|nr:SpoIIE family protein phosphatase [Salinivirgaceae bacterium]